MAEGGGITFTQMDVARFASAYEVGANDCWIWTRRLSPKGYGEFSLLSKNYRAHRVAYQMFVGLIPEGLVLDHICRVRHCVNPAHLRAITAGENVLCGETLAAANKAKTHCAHGHEFTEENTYRYRGERRCRACSMAANKRHEANRSNSPARLAWRKEYAARPDVKDRRASLKNSPAYKEKARERESQPDMKAKRALWARERRLRAKQASNVE
jgi:hypothetical protein